MNKTGTDSHPKERFKLIPAVYLLLRRDNEILLLRRANTGYQDGKYSVIAGHQDGDELSTDAIIREAEEEAGIELSQTDLKFVHIAHRLTRNQKDQERIDLFFEAWRWDGEVTNKEPGKCDDLSWFPLDKLPDNMLPLVRLVIEDVLSGVIYSEYETEPV
ncbi:MAG TPA: NUDIX domain-containing protein [Candidatus Saccharimonadales bacterium]|nr:NUDIX domain-containing protein [Candidatus Saccharimonadales bacterium]